MGEAAGRSGETDAAAVPRRLIRDEVREVDDQGRRGVEEHTAAAELAVYRLPAGWLAIVLALFLGSLAVYRVPVQ